jgi:hypothetical protein
VADSLVPNSFELQLVKLGSTAHSTVIANIYRRPASSLKDFLDELPDVVAKVSAGCTDSLVLCGDVNGPGADGEINAALCDVLNSLDLHQHVKEPTRGANILDIIATVGRSKIDNLHVHDAGLISDHRLITATMSIGPPFKQPVAYTFRDMKQFSSERFEHALRRSALFTSPASTADEFADQIATVVVAELDAVAPLKTSRRRRPQPVTKWLSADAVEAKRCRRRLEKRWKRSGRHESDRVRYRAACRRANRLIVESRRSYYNQRLQDCHSSK